MDFSLLRGLITGKIVFSIVFIYFYLHSGKKYLFYWIFYFALQLVSFLIVVNLDYMSQLSLALVPINIFHIGAFFSLFYGTVKYFKKTISPSWYYIFAFFLLSSLGGLFWDYFYFPAYIFITLMYYSSGKYFYKYGVKRITKITGFAGLLISLVTAIYPFVFRESWFGSRGNVFLSSLLLIFGFGLILIYYEELQEQAKQNEKKYSDLFSYALNAFILLEIEYNEQGEPEDFILQEVNDAFEKQVGFAREDILGQSIKQVYSEVSNYDFIELLEKVATAGESKKTIFCDNLRKKWFQMVFYLPDKDKIAVIFDDITDHMFYRNKIEQLHYSVSILSSCKNHESIYQNTIEAAEEILDFGSSVIVVEEDGLLQPVAYSSGFKEEGLAIMASDEGLVGKAYSTQNSYISADVQQEKDAKPVKNEYHSALTIPLDNYGVFQVISEKIDYYDEEDLKLAELLISHTVTALERIDSQEKIKYMSYHDGLTGLYNRSFLEEEIKRLDTRRKLPISIIMGDVNGLKLANDSFGHDTGDELLQAIASSMESVCRKEDIIARWGGDEYVILLPETKGEEAELIIDRIKKECQKDHGTIVPLSIALGYGVKEEAATDITEVIKKAENKMYDNKLAESRLVRSRIINSLQDTLSEKSNESTEHLQRMENKALALGKKLNLSEEELEKLKLIVSLHDIGKIIVPPEVLQKEDKLNKEEWEKVKKHSETGYRIVNSTDEYAHISMEILSHHEWWDGSGYPRKISGDSIPLLARILSIVDAYDIMIHGSFYKEGVSEMKALQELRKYAGKQFDPELVELFIELENELVGGNRGA
ncbi:MAG: HD domain-containing phosphohydrolase [Bacillota bacterium]